MDIAFRTRKLKKIFNSEKELKKVYGNLAPTIQLRLAVLKNAPTLSAVPTTRPERRHQLQGKLKGQYAVDIGQPYRLVFEPNHDPTPLKEDGGFDTDSITAIGGDVRLSRTPTGEDAYQTLAEPMVLKLVSAGGHDEV